MQISINIPTLGRKEEVRRLLSSIPLTQAKDFEIVIIDQNFSDLLDGIVEEYNSIYNIKHYKVGFRGLSKAKNFGLSQSAGKYIIFMDDDAEFIDDSLKRAVEYLEENQETIAICGRMVDRDGNSSCKKFALTPSKLSITDFEDKFIESSMIFRREAVEKYPYDESLGCGAFHGAEEGYDLVYRLLKDKQNLLYFDPSIIFYHPNITQTHQSKGEIRRVFSYRCGYAALCRKHGFKKKYYKRLFSVLLYLPYLCLFNRKKVRYYISELLGLVSGKVIP